MLGLQKIEQMSHDKIKEMVDSIDHVFFDIDGVLILDKTLIPGSTKTVDKLRQLGKNIAFVSNNTVYPLHALIENLKPFGATVDEIVTPNAALMDYLKKIKFNKDIYVISCPLPKQLLKEAGYNVIEYKDIYPNDETRQTIGEIEKLSLKALEVCKNVGAVLLDLDFNFSIGALQVAKVILNHMEDVILLSGVTDDIVNINKKMKAIGSQFYIEGLERWTRRKAIQMAKPGIVLKEVLEYKFNISDDSRVLFIGDNVNTDIAFGVNSGFKTCLSLSGVTTKDQVEQWIFPENLKPTYVIQSLGELYEKIQDI